MIAASASLEPASDNLNESREAWLNRVASAMAAWFDDLGSPLVPFRVVNGFPSSGRRGRRLAESWSQDGGRSYTIYVRPDAIEPQMIAAALAQQLSRIAASDRDERGYLFRHLTLSIGLRGGRRESQPGLLFRELIAPILGAAGPLPQATLRPAQRALSAKQTTRLIRVVCDECGYVARVARKWLHDVGAPHCPSHGAMRIEDPKRTS